MLMHLILMGLCVGHLYCFFGICGDICLSVFTEVNFCGLYFNDDMNLFEVKLSEIGISYICLNSKKSKDKCGLFYLN